jgi:putative transposase/transposase-like zinc-binding protein
MNRPALEVADILRASGSSFRERHGSHLALQHRKVMDAIVRCRTEALGGHRDQCLRCGHQAISYNSCRNRHCPKCQGNARARWLAARSAELLPVPYFHVVFTLPQELSSLVLQNKRLLYDLLFRSSAAVMIEVARDPKHLGADIGFLSVLHTWGQNLQHHPHVHCVVPAGRLSLDGDRWVTASLLELADQERFRQFLRQLYSKDWVVYAKPPFGGAEHVLHYLARYTHRVAISNHRLVAFREGRVSFRWKDYAHGSKQKIMTVSADEFLRRFLIHVLPRGLVRIRHFGLFANRRRSASLLRCRFLLSLPVPPYQPAPSAQTRCPLCSEPILVVDA